MKILVVSDQWFPDYKGGTARVAAATAEGLADRGHDVVAIVPHHPALPAFETERGVDVRRVVRRGVLPQTLRDMFEMRRAIGVLDLESFDVVLAHHSVAVVAACLAGRHPRKAFVFHSSPLREARQRRSIGLPRQKQFASLGIEGLLAVFERLALSRADRILTLSSFSRCLALDDYPAAASRLDVVGGGVDVERFSPAGDTRALRERLGIDPGDKIVITVRRLVARMGLEVLLEAMQDVCERDDTARLVVVGDGELRENLEAKRDALGLSSRVAFIGGVSEDDVLQWYQAAHVFALPTIAYEGYGMVTAEALACGTPVVGTDAGATCEILNGLDPSLVVPAGDSTKLADALLRTLHADERDIRQRCRQYACDSLSWKSVLGRWQAALEMVTVDDAERDW